MDFSRSFTGTNFQFNFIVFRGHAVSDFNSLKFVQICFMAQKMVYFVNVPRELQKNVCSAVITDNVVTLSLTDIFYFYSMNY